MNEKGNKAGRSDAVFVICCFLVYGLLPILVYADCMRRGYQMGDTDIGWSFVLLYQIVIPPLSCIADFAYMLVTGRLKHCVLLTTECSAVGSFLYVVTGVIIKMRDADILYNAIGIAGFCVYAAVMALVFGGIAFIFRRILK